MSRPEKPIDWDLVDQMLNAGCMGTGIAEHFNIHPQTFYNRVQDKYGFGFTDYSYLKKQQGQELLKHKQFCKAMGYCSDGDNTMLVWLGKNILKQRENPEMENNELEEKKLETAISLLKFLQDKSQSALSISDINNSAEAKS